MASTLPGAGHARGPARSFSASVAGILSNGAYRVLVSVAGTGSSGWEGWALTSGRAGGVEDRDGVCLYVRDRESGACWAASGREAPRAARRWRPGRFEGEHEFEGIEARLEICVAPDAPAELHRLILHNVGERARTLDVTSFAEIVLNDPAAHAAHPVFSKLFLQTEWVADRATILVHRRARAAGESCPWLLHAMLGPGEVEHETDRARFLGRGSPPDAPFAMRSRTPLSGTTGNVLDPCACLRRVRTLAPGARATFTVLLGVAPDRAGAIALAERFAEPVAVAEAFDAAEAAERGRMAALSIDEREAEAWQGLAGAMLHGHPELRADPDVLRRARGTADELARHGVRLDRPFALADGEGARGEAAARELRRAHAYWRALGLPIDVVDGAVLRAVSARERDLLHAAAALVVAEALPAPAVPRSAEVPVTPRPPTPAPPPPDPAPAQGGEPLAFFNGIGGFTADGSEYVIRMPFRGGKLALPPRPWINVLANERFGCLVSETGAGTVWSGNSREHRLTPWSNDPVLDPPSEAFWVRDEETGRFWSLLPGPTPGGDAEMRHGLGASAARGAAEELEYETALFVPGSDPLRVTTARLVNRGRRTRRLSLTAYYRLVLGPREDTHARFVVTDREGDSATVLARSTLAGETGGTVFAAIVAGTQLRGASVTGDRGAFLGPGGHPARPAALARRAPLDGRTGAGLDPCIAQQLPLELGPGEAAEVSFLLGEARDAAEARELVARYSAPDAVRRAREEVHEFWRSGLAAVQIATPSPELDLLVNRWLPYQALACRLWGRTAFYQSGGAFGFRDQLQDAAGLLALWPERTRAQILLHAAHQFAEGDVLHWWHPPHSRGLRTRFADDLLWLPHVTAHYVATTGDGGILRESVRFLTARPLKAGEDEAYVLPRDSGESADLYEHCCRALDRSLTKGAHGLPLFGTGDWNDGMNRVGREGRGESVWMAFFLGLVLTEFVPLCEDRGDRARAERYRRHREELRAAVDSAAWDGEWYRRGYYDNGEPLGSKESDECRIDALVQAWAVLSGMAPPERAARAMDSVERHLISEKDGLIRLLTPPFDRTPNDPGYIKGYVPGVRENGGQYTHAALWVVRAMAELGRNDRVAALLEMLSPVRHARDPQGVAVYQVEPYVVAADVYGEPPHVGRGGWTWYTGAAGWMYRVVLESLLGVRMVGGDTLLVRPCIPGGWPGFTVTLGRPDGKTRVEIRVGNPDGRAKEVVSATLDGRPAAREGGSARIPLPSDGRRHLVEILLGAEGSGHRGHAR